MSRFNVKVTRVLFPHPRRVKFSLPWPEPAGPDVEGVQAWVCYRATKEEAAKIDTAAVLEAYIEQGALEGSRVTVELIPTETVRAAEITEKHRLAEKVAVYAEASGQDPTLLSLSVIEKADQLEREAEERGAAAGMHFRLRRCLVRGAIGTWKGLRQDEIDIDLDRYDPGLISLIGANGAGKSTLIENMHPYPCMLTRDGKLQDHFRLRDSARELWFVDERTGTEYRALMEIDGANSSGGIECHLFRSGEPFAGGKGRQKEYLAAIERLIGSLPLFLRSAFVSQRPTKNNPDLADATKGDRKAIFRELAGQDYLQGHSEKAGSNAKQLESQVTVGRGQVTLLERMVAEEPQVRRSVEAEEWSVKDAEERIAGHLKKGQDLKHHVEQLAAAVAEQDQIGKEIDTAANDAQKKLGQVQTARTTIEKLEEALDSRDFAQVEVDHYAQLKEQEGAENERLSGINKERSRLLAEHGDRVTAHRVASEGLQAAKTKVSTAIAGHQADRRVLQTKIDHLEAELSRALTLNCPTCGQLLPETKRAELETKRTENETLLADWKQKTLEIDRELQDLARQLKEAEANITALTAPVKPTLPLADEAELARIRGALGQIDITTARATLETAAKAEQEIATLTAQIATLEGDARSLNEKAEQLSAKIFPKVRTKYSEALTAYEAARTAYTTAKEERATAQAKLEASQQQMEAILKQKCEMGELKASMAKIEAEAEEWRYLEQACGPDGIQALELDAMGPGISEVANRLLSAAYGSRFSIELRTTRMAGKGSKTKQVEDFAIIVIDNELMTEQPIETLSGGESVWIKQAIYAAFSIVRDKTTGIRFLTCFKDECDGALDPESRAKYFQMLEAEHNESGRRNTLIITHSESAQEMIQQRIEMRRAS